MKTQLHLYHLHAQPLVLGWGITFLASGNLSSAGNFCKKFGPRSGPTKCWSWSGSKLFDTVIAFLKEFFEKVNRRQLITYPCVDCLHQDSRVLSKFVCLRSSIRSFITSLTCKHRTENLIDWLQSPNLKERPTIWASSRENQSSGVCEQQSRRTASASALTDQRLCYSLTGMYHI